MRIISGQFRGRKITPPGNLPIRPTTDQAKEALFNILRNTFDFENSRVLDLFAGTGNISFEFASRGCQDIISVEVNYKCARFIKDTAARLGITGLRVIRTDVFRYIKTVRERFDLVFADPPYDMEGLGTLAELIFISGILNEDGALIIEHPKEIDFSTDPHFTGTRRYGHVSFSFFKSDL